MTSHTEYCFKGQVGLNLREAAVTSKNLRKGLFLQGEASPWEVLRPTRERLYVKCAYIDVNLDGRGVGLLLLDLQ